MAENTSKPKDKKEVEPIDRKTQIAMMKFFLNTSVPKILKDKEKANLDFNRMGENYEKWESKEKNRGIFKG